VKHREGKKRKKKKEKKEKQPDELEVKRRRHSLNRVPYQNAKSKSSFRERECQQNTEKVQDKFSEPDQRFDCLFNMGGLWYLLRKNASFVCSAKKKRIISRWRRKT